MTAVDDIKARLDIVDVVSSYVTLKKVGRNFKAPCPFHTEKTPSFVVNTERQSWHCFGACGTGGDAFSFVMRKENLGFSEAMRLLADRAGVTLEERGQHERTDFLLRVNQDAATFYQEMLASADGTAARDYLNERGIDEATAESFQIGLSPKGQNSLNAHLSSLGHDIDHAIQAGLLRRRDDESIADFFWGRLMFPIHDRRGRVAGFGARSMDGSDPKYINTPGTRVFNKRSMLYGLHKAAGTIREGGTAVIVEGYMDAIAAHQHGDANAVASMGTALTEQQVSTLRQIAKRVVMALDADPAGQEATHRSLESSWQVFERATVARATVGPLYAQAQDRHVDLFIAPLPRGVDPDDLIRKDPEAWKTLIRDAVPVLDFLIDSIPSRYDLADARGRAEALDAVSPLIPATLDPTEQERHFANLASVLGVSREALEASISRPRTQRRGSRPGARRPDARPADPAPLRDAARDLIEEYVLALLLARFDLAEIAAAAKSEYFHGTENREVFTCWQACSRIEEVRAKLDEGLHDHLDRLLATQLSPTEQWPAEQALTQSLGRLAQRYLKEHQQDLLASDDSTTPPPLELEGHIVDTNSQIRSEELGAARRS